MTLAVVFSENWLDLYLSFNSHTMKKFMSLFTPLFVLFSTGYSVYQAVLEPTAPMVFMVIVFTALIVPSINILKESK